MAGFQVITDKDWGNLIGDVPADPARKRRLLNAHVIAITGKSYRMKNRAGRKSEDPRPPKSEDTA